MVVRGWFQVVVAIHCRASCPSNWEVILNNSIPLQKKNSVLTAWAGYSIRHMQQTKIDKRLHSIEQSLRDTHKVEHDEIKKIVTSYNISTSACIATALTTTVVGYALGWRGGAWYARRIVRREQQKLMGQIKSQNRWHWRPFSKLRTRFRSNRHASKSSDAPQLPGKDASASANKGQGA